MHVSPQKSLTEAPTNKRVGAVLGCVRSQSPVDVGKNWKVTGSASYVSMVALLGWH